MELLLLLLLVMVLCICCATKLKKKPYLTLHHAFQGAASPVHLVRPCFHQVSNNIRAWWLTVSFQGVKICCIVTLIGETK